MRNLRSVSQRMLPRNLRNLESTGLVTRRVTRSKTFAVEYSLTRLGKTLVAHSAICPAGRSYCRSPRSEQTTGPGRVAGSGAGLARCGEGAHAPRRRAGAATPGAAVGFRSRRSTASRPIKEAPRFRRAAPCLYFMFAPDFTTGRPSCLASADGFNDIVVHLVNHDAKLWAVNRNGRDTWIGTKRETCSTTKDISE